MYNTLKTYTYELKDRYNALLKAKLAKKRPASFSDKLNELIRYNTESIKFFQHERGIHLAVTLFFVVLLLISAILTGVFIVNFGFEWGSFDWASLANLAGWASLPFELVFFASIFLVNLILLILTLFYVRHYYLLENSIQKLYELHKKIFELTD